jgi:glyoxylase-like metal-dependent hydrolase (beta-lactamase superfamily II)
MLWTNCYVIFDEAKDAVVVDPGGPMQEVREFLNKAGLNVRWVLITHGHGDHIFGVNDIRTLASEGVAIHEEDSVCLIDAAKNLSYSMGNPAVFGKAERILKDGDVIDVGSMRIEVIHTPGHTRGGCCFHVAEGDQELLISGDTLFARSVGRTDLPGGDETTLARSLEKLAKLPDSLVTYPGHGPDTTIGDERRLNPFWPR